MITQAAINLEKPESSGSPAHTRAGAFNLKLRPQQSKIKKQKSRFLALWPYALYTAAFAVCWLTGMRMTIRQWFFQLLAPEWARDRLLESLWHLHMQPPALNLLYGLALKFAARTGFSPESFLLALHFLMGFAYVRAVMGLTSRFIPDPRVGLGTLLFLLLNPVLYVMAYGFFYTWHETIILAAMAWEIWRYLEEPTARRYAWVCAWMMALIYVRSLFHFAWAIVALAALLWAGRDTWAFYAGRAKRALGVFALTAAVLLAWPAKNAALFGMFGYSSWAGYNFSQEIIYYPFYEEDPIPEKYKDIPSLTVHYRDGDLRDPPKEENWNRIGIIGPFKRVGKATLEAIRREPGLLIHKMIRNYWNYTRFAGRHPHFAGLGEVAPPTKPVEWWMRIWETVFLLDFRLDMNLKIWTHRSAHPPRPWHISGFTVLFPVILAIPAWWAWRGWRGGDPIRARMTAFMLWAILWTLAMCLCVDGGEGNRMRFSTELYVVLLAGWIISRGLAWRRRWLASR